MLFQTPPFLGVLRSFYTSSTTAFLSGIYAMSSRSISLAALSCLLLVSGTGCSQISNLSSSKASESLEGALTETIEEAQAATTGVEAVEEIPEVISQAGYVKAAEEASARAQNNAKTAVTRAEWTQVDGDWQQAINNLEAVGEDAAEYGEARTKLASYKNSQAAASKNYLSADEARYDILTTSPVNDAAKAGTFEADARQVREWLYKGEFKKVNTLLRSSVSSNRRTSNGMMYADAVLVNVFNGPGVVASPKLMTQLNKWVEAEPENAMAYAVRAYSNQASITWTRLFLVRPDDSRESLVPEISVQPLTVSLMDAEVALELESGNRLAHLAKLRMAKIIGLGQEETEGAVEQADEFAFFEPNYFETTFKAAKAAMPSSYEVVQEKAQYLLILDRSGARALEYLRPVAASAPANSAVPMLIPMIHFMIGSTNEIMAEHLQKPDVWDEVQKNAERAISGLPESGLFPAWYAYMASRSNNSEVANKYMQIAMNNGGESPLVQSFLRMMM